MEHILKNAIPMFLTWIVIYWVFIFIAKGLEIEWLQRGGDGHLVSIGLSLVIMETIFYLRKKKKVGRE